MAIKIKTCPVCGRQFQAKNSSAIYCSGRCKSRAYRRYGRSEPIRDPEESEEVKEQKRKDELMIRSQQRQRELEAAAGSGDGVSRMITAKRFSPEYFAALADYEDQYARGSGRTSSSCTINGISVNDPDFAESAAYAVKTDGVFVMGH